MILLAAFFVLVSPAKADVRRAPRIQFQSIRSADPGPLKKGGKDTASTTPTPIPTAAPASMPSSSSALLNAVKSGAGSSSQISSGNGSGGDKYSIGFDDDAPKGQAPTVVPKQDQGGEKPGGPKGGPDKKNKVVAFKLWWPACIFVDPAVPNGNEIVKGLVDNAAKCGVNLVVFPFYIKNNYPKSADALNAMAKKSCNATDGFKEFGANRASVATIVNNKSLVQQMCKGGARDKTGCAETGYDPGYSQQLRMANAGEFGGVSGVGKTAASIIGPGGFNVQTVATYLQGMAQMALPNGTGGGMGVGDWNEGNASGGAQPEKNWSDRGCASMRQASFPNDGRWRYNPDQDKYLARGSADRAWDLASGRQLFQDPNKPPAGEKPAGGNGGGSPSGPGGGADASPSIAAGGGSTPGAPSAPAGGVAVGSGPPPGGGHKDLAVGGGRNSGVKSVGNIYGGGSASGGEAGDGSTPAIGGSSSPDVAAALSAEAEKSPIPAAAAKALAAANGKGGDGLSVGFDDTVGKGGLDPNGLLTGGNNGAAGTNGAPGEVFGPANGGAGALAEASGRNPANVGPLNQIKGGNGLSDEFFRKLGFEPIETDLRRRKPGGLRNSAAPRSDQIYQ